MNNIRPQKMRTLRDIMLEKERLRYMLLRTELEFEKSTHNLKKIFTFPEPVNQVQSLIADYIRNAVNNWLK